MDTRWNRDGESSLRGATEKNQNLLLKGSENQLEILREKHHRHTILRRYGNEVKT